MENNEKFFQLAVDRAKTMARLSVFSCISGIILAILTLVLGTIVTDYTGSDTFALGFPVYTICTLFSIAALIFAVLSKAANQEEIDKILLEKRKADHHAFDVDEDVRFTSGRAFSNYKKYAPYVITIMAALILITLLSSYAMYWNNPDRIKAGASNTMRALITAILFMCASGFIGAFYIGQARSASSRWLRAVGGWFMMGFVIMLAASIEICLVHFKITGFEHYFSWICWSALVVLTAEFAVSFIVDFYRPRTIEEPRPIFESAILSLFTEPGGVMRNIADTLDYQFGFKVSGTYIYTFIERALFPAITIWLVVLWLFTSIDQIGPNQRGFRIRNGSLVSTEPLTPGTYLKLPWPFEHFLRYDCTEIHQIVIGNVHDHGNEEEEYVDDGHGHTPPPSQAEKDAMEATIKHLAYWDMHSDDDGSSYMVAVTTDGVQDTSGLPTNIAFVNVTFPIQYQIRESELLQYAFSNNNPEKTLEMIAESAATEYLASANLMGVLAYDRQKIASAIQEKIQQQADEMGLGVDIVNVVMIDVHPAAKVVPAYQQVISAQEEMRTNQLNAEVDRVKQLPLAQANAYQIIAEAEAYSISQKLVAAADAKRFAKQLAAYEALPPLFKLRSYLDIMENDAAGVRKFIVGSELKDEVYELNFEESVNFNFADMQLGQ